MTTEELWIYASFFAALVATGFGLNPLPEEICVSTAGVFAATTSARWWVLLPVCILGVLISDVVLYAIGHRYGTRILDHPWVARFVRPETRRRIEQNFQQYGISILILGRLVPGIRAPLFLTAGATRLPLNQFVLADAIGAVFGNSLFFFLAFFLGNQFVNLVKRVDDLGPLLLFAALVAVAAVLAYQFLRHPVSTGDPKEVPLIGSQVAEHLHHKPPEGGHCHPAAPKDQPADQPTEANGNGTQPPRTLESERVPTTSTNGHAAHLSGQHHGPEGPTP
jgi:membrane protein DedA with SNARE-associated domain